MGRACMRCNGNCAHSFFSVVLLLFYVTIFCFFGRSIEYFAVVLSFKLLLLNFLRLYPVCCYLAWHFFYLSYAFGYVLCS